MRLVARMGRRARIGPKSARPSPRTPLLSGREPAQVRSERDSALAAQDRTNANGESACRSPGNGLPV